MLAEECLFSTYYVSKTRENKLKAQDMAWGFK